MSTNMVERVLWEICSDPGRAAQFQTDSDAFLSAYRLEPEEKNRIADLKVRSLADQGVSQMLLMMTWNVLVGPDKVGEYLGHMNAPV